MAARAADPLPSLAWFLVIYLASLVLMAAVVTITDAIVALPFAYHMARIVSPRAPRAVHGHPAAPSGPATWRGSTPGS